MFLQSVFTHDRSRKQQNLSISTSLVCNSSTKHEVLLKSLTVAVRKFVARRELTKVVKCKGEMQKQGPRVVLMILSHRQGH